MTLLSERSLVFAQADAATLSASVNEHLGQDRHWYQQIGDQTCDRSLMKG